MSIEQAQADDERRRAEEEAIAASDRDYAVDCMIRRDKMFPRYDSRLDTAVDGRPLMLSTGNGPVPFETMCKPPKEGK